MEVILLKDLDLGDRGAIVKVSDGYARNFLFPNRLAVLATANNKQHVQQIAQQQKKKLDKEKAAVEMFAKKINEYPEISIKVKGSEAGALYGAITNAQLAEVLKQALGTEIDKKRIMLKQLREPGSFEVPIRLTFGITAKAKVKIELEMEKKKETEEKEKKSRTRKKKEETEEKTEETEAPAAETEKAEKAKKSLGRARDKEKVAKEAKA